MSFIETIEKIRPAGRHILTIGRNLIKDNQAAIIELVKNAYDADSPGVNITFKVSENRENLTITIKDNGHGMSQDTVVNKWLVPSTDDKQKRKVSPGGRIMQGRKGVGRYAASILGDDLLLKTIDTEGNKTEIFLEWDKFEKYNYLDEIDILLVSSTTSELSSTELTITGGIEFVKEWTELDRKNNFVQINNLIKELRKLLSPIVKDELNQRDDRFSISLHLNNIKEGKEDNIDIEPLPIFDLYDYRIEGVFTEDGKGTFNFYNAKTENVISEKISIFLDEKCGKIKFDIRVFDREQQSIEFLQHRLETNGHYLGINEIRNHLNEINGIGVYRNGFRIRPLGDPDFDWLKLNEKRIQNPSQRIGNNQVLGFIHIQDEKESGLEEKSARDGLKENKSYESFKRIAVNVLNELEIRRYAYRRKVDLIQKSGKIHKDIEKLMNFDTVKAEIKSYLNKEKISENIFNELESILQKDEEKKSKIIDDISAKIAIYQGQATLGKIVNVVLHEGRKPLNFFNNQVKNAKFWIDELKDNYSQDVLNETIDILSRFSDNSKALSDLFKRIDPLAAGTRCPKQEIALSNIINDAFAIFEEELIKNKIVKNINCPENLKIYCWKQDISIILTNLIDNSLYWINNKKNNNNEISVIVTNDDNNFITIDFKDTGIGINKDFIESEIIFDPEFSTKPNGTGLGLALAGEAAVRNQLVLKAIEYDNGAHFRLHTNLGSEND